MNETADLKTGTTKDIVRMLNEEGYTISEWNIRRLIKAGEIPALTVGSRKKIISLQIVKSYLDRHLNGEEA